MSYQYSRVPSAWTPDRAYEIAAGVWLLPGERLQIRDTRFRQSEGSTSWVYLDHLFFAAAPESREAHVDSLKEWLPFHAFLTADNSGIEDLEQRVDFTVHSTATSLDDITVDDSTLVLRRDFDHIGRSVYHPHEGAPDICYRDAFGVYRGLNGDQRGAIINWLLGFTRFPHPLTLTIRDPSYWQIAKDASILEYVLGNPANCPEHPSCGECNRELWHRDLRCGNQGAWREDRLRERIGAENGNLVRQYHEVVERAFRPFRHGTAHPGEPPSATWMWPQAPREVWDLQRAMSAYKNNALALLTIVNTVRGVARFLLLHELFHFGFFPPPMEAEVLAAYLQEDVPL